MKKSRSIFALVFMVFFLEGCKNNDPAPDPSLELIGIWKADTSVQTGCTNPVFNYNVTCTSNCEILDITGTALLINGDGPFEYTTNGNFMTLNIAGATNEVTYSISGETLTITDEEIPAGEGCKAVKTYKKFEYSQEVLTDIDGNTYHALKIGKHVWMLENLRVTKYRNGDPIVNLTDGIQWKNATSGAYCNYDNSDLYAGMFGKIYNWHAVNDSRKIAPAGWHVASDDEWTELTDYLGGESVAGGKLKQVGTAYWLSPNAGATNESHFTALPGGTRYPEGAFDNQARLGYWWTSTGDPGGAWYRYVIWENAGVHRFGHLLQSGFSVRCVKD